MTTSNDNNHINDENWQEKKYEFKVGDAVVYPTHGVGRLTGENKESISGQQISFYQVEFNPGNDSGRKLTLRVPKHRAVKSGLRPLYDVSKFDQAIDELKKTPKAPKSSMWNKRAQDYDAKINSGDPIAIASVLRELHKNMEDQSDRSFSERAVYELALERLATEYAASKEISFESAKTKIIDTLIISSSAA